MWEHRAENAAALSEKSLWESRRWTGFSFLWEAAKDLAAVTSHTPQLSSCSPTSDPWFSPVLQEFSGTGKGDRGGPDWSLPFTIWSRRQQYDLGPRWGHYL